MHRADSLDSLLRLLRQNEAENSARFKEAGIGVPMKIAVCRKCGLSESLVFWTWEHGSPNSVQFRCPTGCSTHIHHSPNGEPEEESPKPARSFNPHIVEWILVPVFLYVLGGYLTGTPLGEGVVSELWRISQSQIYSAASVLAES